MNGRCDKDPFQRAVDVCDNCYHNICEHCVVELPGRRHPICPQCAVRKSGVNPGAPERPKADRKSVKERRAFNQSQAGQTDEVFTYFDEQQPSEAPTNKRRSWLRRIVNGVDSLSTDADTIDTSVERPVSATDRLADIRDGADAAAAKPDEPRPAPVPADSAVPHADVEAEEPVAPWNKPFVETNQDDSSSSAEGRRRTDGSDDDESDALSLAPGLEQLLKKP